MSNKNNGPTLYFSQFGGERPIPEQFIAAMERAEERTKVPVDSKLPEFSDEIVEARFDTRYENTNEKWLVVIRKKAGVVGPLLDRRTTDQGQSVQVEATMFRTKDDTFPRSFPSSTQDVSVKDLGNGWSIQEVAVAGTWVDGIFTPGIFQGVELTTRKDDPLPTWMRTGAEEIIVQSVVEGTVEQPDLADNDLLATERQLAQSKKLKSRLTREEIALPSTQRLVKQLEDLLPVKFRGLLPLVRDTIAVAGVVTEPILQVGELMRSEEQVSITVKLVEILSRAGVTFPVEIVETATITEYGGGRVNIITRIDVVGILVPEEGEQFVSSRVTKLGEGHEMRETVVRVAGAWPTLPFSRFDARLQLVLSGTKQVVAKGSTTSSIISGVITEIEEIDGYRERKILTSQPLSVVDSYIRVLDGNTTNVDVPPQLDSLIGYVDGAGGPGSYSETGTYSISSGGGNGGIQLRGSAQASAATSPEIGWIVRIPRTNNIPCIHVLFYVANGTLRPAIITTLSGILVARSLGTCSDWPDFRPQPITIKTVGGKININAQVNVSAHDAITIDYLGAPKFTGTSRSTGSGTSFDSAINTRIIQIPATIHGALTIGNQTDVTVSFGAVGAINGGGAGGINTSALCSSRGLIDILSSTIATTGNTFIPSTGKRVHRLVTEPDPAYDRVRVFAEVVDFADIVP